MHALKGTELRRRVIIAEFVLAVLGGFAIGLYVLVVANALSGPQASAAARRWGGVVMLGVLVQVAAGVVNILLSAPGWLQVVHLLLGTGLWVALITFALAVLGPRRPA